MKKSAKIIFFGNERLSTGFEPQGSPTLSKLLDAGYQVSAVICSHSNATSRNARSLAIADYANQHNIPIHFSSKKEEVSELIDEIQPDIGILVAYGKIIPEYIIDKFPYGIINLHPSLLPKYRGSTPIESAILNGDPQTGISVMQLVKAMDAGPILYQQVISTQDGESKEDLTQKLLDIGSTALVKLLPDILDGQIVGTSQNESDATYTKLISKGDALLKPKQKPATQILREIRAFAGWPKSKLEIFGKTITVLSARITNVPSDKSLIIKCMDGNNLEILKLIAPSGKIITGEEFVRGYKKINLK